MTLIAFATHGDRATIATDTLAYDRGGRRMGHTSKALPLPHLDAAMMTQGTASFGIMAGCVIPRLGYLAPTFDALVTETPGALREAWAEVVEYDRIEATAFLVGYSEAAGEFAAYGFAAEHDFEPWRIEGTFVMPTPRIFRASEFELARLAAEGDVDPQMLEEWRKAMPLPEVETAEDWTEVALAAWRDRSRGRIAPTVFIGGRLHLTRLARGKVSTETIHTFDQDSEEFRDMVRGTLHPLGQVAPCSCGSGSAFADCCLDVDLPCPCGSRGETKTIRECCLLNTEERATVA